MRALTSALLDRGDTAAAQQLDDAVAGGSTGTEILDRLWVTLGGFELEDRDLRRRVRSLRRSIARQLKI